MTATGLVIQNPSTWGLASISSRTPGASGYVFDNAGTHATFSYVLDTGIRLTHQDFGGRALFGANYAGDADNDDANGHGTKRQPSSQSRFSEKMAAAQTPPSSQA
jgi:hypothetical protein